MLKNYLKIAFRTLRKQKVVSAVTIGSLAVGLACCLLLFLYVEREWTYDRFHADADRIYRVVGVEVLPSGEHVRTASGKVGTGPALAEAFPEIEEVVRFTRRDVSITVGPNTFEERVTLADSSALAVFDGFRLRHGGAQTALDDPSSVVLSVEAAQRYFGTDQALGRHLRIAFEEEALEATVTGVVEAPSSGSSIPFEIVLPFDNLEKEFSAQVWSMISADLPLARTYVRLSETADVEALERRMAALMETRAEGEPKVVVSGQNKTLGYRLQPLTAVHLDPSVKSGLAPTSNPAYSYTLSGIALLVLLLACINFMTLSLGRSAGRAREVGIRKTVGAQREQVAFQFWGEALLTTALALVLGVALTSGMLPLFNRLTGQELQLGLLDGPVLWVALAGLVAVVGLVAGGYPALVLSRFDPVPVLRGHGGGHLGGGSRLAQALVVVQFALSVALVAGALVMAKQLGYLTKNSLHVDAAQVVRISAGAKAAGTDSYDADDPTFYDRFRHEALRQGHVEAVAGASISFPGNAMPNNLRLGDTASVRVHMNGVSENFLQVMEVGLVAGRGFESGASASRQPALVNRALVRAMGWPSAEAALGQELPLEIRLGRGGVAEATEIVGVVEDFAFLTLHEEIAPLVLVPLAQMPHPAEAVFVRFPAERTGEVLASLEEVWRAMAPASVPFAYEFLDEIVRRQYEAERQWQALVRYAAVLALLVSCAGLFGLALLAVRRREKEIGIRKVLGASAAGVVALVARQFALLVAAGFVLAVPLAWLGARRWLQTFAYRTEVGAGPFLVAGLAVLAVAMATVGYQALRAARLDPVHSLRSE